MRYRLERHVDGRTLERTFADDVRRGLTGAVKSLPPKYFYDAAGSALFEAITALPEYYVTRAETELLAASAADVMRIVRPGEIVELGAGGSTKVAHLIAAHRGNGLRYVPLDVDASALGAGARRLLGTYPFLDVHAVVGDFERHLDRVPPSPSRRLVIFLGSTIGNLDEEARHGLLCRVRRLLGDRDRLLLGVDLVKDLSVLEPAYADAQGVTAEFNRNILHVLNRRLAATFDPRAFRHVAFYNQAAARIEMHLVADHAQRVTLPRLGLTVNIAAGESIWTESSYKFTAASTAAMLADAGLILERWYTDPAQQVALALASVG
ncbi:MAG: L-histidine N(alpha)-methyltransferase [Candidatus Rokuibacteriota bacterium]